MKTCVGDLEFNVQTAIIDLLPRYVSDELVGDTELGHYCFNKHYKEAVIRSRARRCCTCGQFAALNCVNDADSTSKCFNNIAHFEIFLRTHPYFKPRSIIFESWADYVHFSQRLPYILEGARSVCVSDFCGQVPLINADRIDKLVLQKDSTESIPMPLLDNFINLKTLHWLGENFSYHCKNITELTVANFFDVSSTRIEQLNIMCPEDLDFSVKFLPPTVRALSITCMDFNLTDFDLSCFHCLDSVNLKFRIRNSHQCKALVSACSYPPSLTELKLDFGESSGGGAASRVETIELPDVETLHIQRLHCINLAELKYPDSLRNLNLSNLCSSNLNSLKTAVSLKRLELNHIAQLESFHLPLNLRSLRISNIIFKSLSLKKFTMLHDLTMSYNNLECIELPDNLVYLNLIGSFVSSLQCPPNLQGLRMSVCSQAFSIKYNERIEHLDLYIRSFHDLPDLQPFPQTLKQLQICNGYGESQYTESLAVPRNLIELSLHGFGLTDEAVEFPQALKKLSLTNNRYTRLPELAGLTHLNMRLNDINVSDMVYPESLKGLKELDLSNNFSNGSIALDLNSTALESLNLNGNNISGGLLRLPPRIESLAILHNRLNGTDWINADGCECLNISGVPLGC